MSSAMESAKEAAHSVGEKVTDFLQGNPFATPVGRKIELATDASTLATENWGLNIEICDFINNTAEGGRDAIRAIRKRLQTQMAKNNAVVMYTLTVLETCVKNCDARFHALVCQKDFIMDLVKLVGPKFDAPQLIQERVLGLIQPALNGVCLVYDDLKSKGVEFPMTDLDAMAPILTPKRMEGAVIATSPLEANATQLSKLRQDLDLVQGNINILQELLSDLPPGREAPEDLELMKEISAACAEMQRRIAALLQVVMNEPVTNELLAMNDQLNAVLHKYERHMGNRVTAQEQQLIQFDTPQTLTLGSQLASLKVNEAATVPPAVSALESSYRDNASGLDQAQVGLHTAAHNKTQPINEREAEEMEKWLKAQEEQNTSEFDVFMNRRADTKKEDDGL